MPLDPALAELIRAKLAHATVPQWAIPIAEVRRAFSALWTPALTGEAAAVARIEDIAIPDAGAGVRARLYAPASAGRCPVMLYFHGGGYVKGGIEESDSFCRNLARATDHIVVSVDYRLAPEHPFPAALDDAYAATSWTCAHLADLGGAPGPVVVCGESAGGNLAAVTCIRARQDPHVAIRFQVLLQPVVDFMLSFASMALPATECLVPRDDLAWYYRTYYGDERDRRDACVSPLYADDLSRLPSALIIAAEFDTLRDEAAAYAERLVASGVPARYHCYPGMVHGFLQMGGVVSQAGAALREIAQALG
jgi:acetyl esterase